MSEETAVAIFLSALTWLGMGISVWPSEYTKLTARSAARLKLACVLGMGPIVVGIWWLRDIAKTAELPGFREPAPPETGNLSSPEE